MHIVIAPPSTNAPAGKLADAELHFTTGPLAGLTLVGFCIWESQWPTKNPAHPHLRVTVPSREYMVNGEKRRFDLLRSNDPADRRRPARRHPRCLRRAHRPAAVAAAVVRQVARAAQAKSSAYRGQPVSDYPRAGAAAGAHRSSAGPGCAPGRSSRRRPRRACGSSRPGHPCAGSDRHGADPAQRPAHVAPRARAPAAHRRRLPVLGDP